MLTIEKVYDAQKALEGVARKTDVIYAPKLCPGIDLYLKTENLQTTGSFKLRGAYYKMTCLSDEEKANVATEFASVQQMIDAYNETAQTANNELADATEIAFAPIVATGFTFLAALWFLLKKKFFI